MITKGFRLWAKNDVAFGKWCISPVGENDVAFGNDVVLRTVMLPAAMMYFACGRNMKVEIRLGEFQIIVFT